MNKKEDKSSMKRKIVVIDDKAVTISWKEKIEKELAKHHDVDADLFKIVLDALKKERKNKRK